MSLPSFASALAILSVVLLTACDGVTVLEDPQTEPSLPTELTADDEPSPPPSQVTPMGSVCDAGFEGGGVYADVVDAQGEPVAFAWATDNCRIELSTFTMDFSSAMDPVVRILEADGTLVSEGSLEPLTYDDEYVSVELIAQQADGVPIGPHLGQTLWIVDTNAPDETYIRGMLWAP